MSGFRSRFLPLLLWLMALHSLAVGCALLCISPAAMEQFGYRADGERFFGAQGGVFHLVMAVAYLLAASNPDQCRALILLILITKFTATVFLVGYYFIVEPIRVVLLSGIGDLLMGLLVLWAVAIRPRPGNLAERL